MEQLCANRREMVGNYRWCMALFPAEVYRITGNSLPTSSLLCLCVCSIATLCMLYVYPTAHTLTHTHVIIHTTRNWSTHLECCCLWDSLCLTWGCGTWFLLLKLEQASGMCMIAYHSLVVSKGCEFHVMLSGVLFLVTD